MTVSTASMVKGTGKRLKHSTCSVQVGLLHYSEEFLLADLTVSISVRLVDHFLKEKQNKKQCAEVWSIGNSSNTSVFSVIGIQHKVTEETLCALIWRTDTKRRNDTEFSSTNDKFKRQPHTVFLITIYGHVERLWSL